MKQNKVIDNYFRELNKHLLEDQEVRYGERVKSLLSIKRNYHHPAITHAKYSDENKNFWNYDRVLDSGILNGKLLNGEKTFAFVVKMNFNDWLGEVWVDDDYSGLIKRYLGKQDIRQLKEILLKAANF